MADLKKLQEAENINLPRPNTYAEQLEAAVANTGKPYQYDFNADQLYQDYKKNYMTEAQKARNNVIDAGKQYTAAHPDTYVESSANQQYQNYMAEINRLAPTFENLAYARHQQEEEDALKNAQLLGKLDAEEYARYRDSLGDLRNYRNYALGNYKYDVGFENEQAALANKADTANKEYFQRLYKDQIEKAAAEKAAAEAAAAAARASRGGGRRGGGGGGGDYPSNVDTSVDTSRIYNQNGSTKSGNLDWVRVAGLSRISGTELKRYMDQGYIGYWTDANNKDHYSLTTKGQKWVSKTNKQTKLKNQKKSSKK